MIAMRWTTYVSRTDQAEHAALLVDGELFGVDRPLIELLRSDLSLAAWGERAMTAPWERCSVEEAALVAPIPVPPSIRDFMAFENHVVTSYAALGTQVSPVWYDQPVFYFSNPAAVLGPQDVVTLAPGSERFDYELEIAAVIGRAGRDLHPDTAEDHIAGYLILCDWSARDLQSTEMQVGLGPAKGKDTATSLGPYLVTPDELGPFRAGRGFDLGMRATVNGREYSSGNWSDLYWSFGEMLAYASRGTELRPGDLIGSGTVGTGCILELGLTHGVDRYPWLRPGDDVLIEVDQLGAVRTSIQDTPAAGPIPLR
jgi:2-keto-4-pentenoate hydratase/2-oxohepta-3-ene-1,7-dioic acid hydratase in catechol pathway